MATGRSWVDFRRKNRTVFTALIICFLFFHLCRRSTISTNIPSQHRSTLYCPQNLIAKEVLVVLRTGATEVLEKLPVHLDTTLRCIPNYAIYSDYEEDIEGSHIHDVFDELSQDLKESVPDFELYHRLKMKGRDGLSIDGTEHDGSGPSGLLDNPGWKLDKFKFLPMIDKALRHSPQAKWFVFVELDTYLMWGNLLDYLSKFDAEIPHYIGKVTEHWRAHMVEYNQYTIEQWAGDMVLGKALKDVLIPLLWAFPHFQGDPVSTLDHNITKINRQPWCYPVITYHHMPEDEIRSLWEFEQEWQRMHPRDVPLRHANVFKGYIHPYLSKERTEWDNYSVNPEFSKHALKDGEAHTSFEACRSACESNAMCLQFSYRTSMCLVSSEVRLGRRATLQCSEYSTAASKCDKTEERGLGMGEGSLDAVRSGWMVDRLAKYVSAMDQTCNDHMGWII
ncbi:glycosyltransferase family 31 protein [Macroventuria anomochaeta]|uniref:Glycosyltransferase family 31 protein n=1 Tax=Macroventuria anomochaeta TaxID=301207 RepID=A0ACB6RNU8_9PLEO|nr:glycosyltransferase family 31 protein [Macroventuria anomochaeta]KAF2623566.1 glycosyltransferase family 31 protein [Macroventuria anomochaeta]